MATRMYLNYLLADKGVLNNISSFFRLLLAIVFLFTLSSCSKKHKGGGTFTSHSLQFNGIKRTYKVYKPKGFDASASVPMIIALHGRGANGKNGAKHMRLNPVADLHNTIVVYPDGHKRSWDDGRNTTPASKAGVDDIAFMAHLIDVLKKDLPVDESKIYMIGLSNGAYLSLSFSCYYPEKLAAVCAVIGSMAPNPSEWCNPQHPVPILLMAGNEDPIVPYEGGKITKNLHSESVQTVFTFWAKHNNCVGSAEKISYPNFKKDGTTVELERYRTCDKNTEVLLYTIEGGGHAWPGGSQYLPAFVVGRASQEIKAEEIVFEFFLKHSR